MSAPARGRRDQRGRLRTDAEAWREELAAEDSAPDPEPTRIDPAEWGVTALEARALLQRQMCPVCRTGPWKSPLNHVARKHGILRWDMRNACGLTTHESVCDAELSRRFVERGKDLGSDAARAMTAKRDSRPESRRWTEAGRQRVIQNLADWEKANPEAAYAIRLANVNNPDAHAKVFAPLVASADAALKAGIERGRSLGRFETGVGRKPNGKDVALGYEIGRREAEEAARKRAPGAT